jgi:hypothetical protein
LLYDLTQQDEQFQVLGLDGVDQPVTEWVREGKVILPDLPFDSLDDVTIGEM